jgi:hypothetical protein
MTWKIPERFDPMGEHTHLAVDVLVGLVDAEVDIISKPAMRPVFALLVTTQKDHGQGPTLTLLVNWMQLAVLHGQVRATRGSLPVHLRDEWRSLERDAFAASQQSIEQGRPTDG